MRGVISGLWGCGGVIALMSSSLGPTCDALQDFADLDPISLRILFGLTSIPIRFKIVPYSSSLRNYFELTFISHRSLFGFNYLSLQFHFGFTSLPLQFYGFAMASLRMHVNAETILGSF